MQAARIVVLVSGKGSNLQALIDATKGNHESIELDASIVAVISNRPNALALKRATDAGIEGVSLDHTLFDQRQDFDQALLDLVSSYSADLIILAGFMRILSPVFVQALNGKLMNTHPSLLPKYPGLNTHQRALEAGDKEHGVTVHFVTEELDGGPPIVQARVPIMDNDTSSSLTQRVLEQEHRVYPLAAQWFVSGRLQLKEGKAILDGETLPKSGADQTEEVEA